MHQTAKVTSRPKAISRTNGEAAKALVTMRPQSWPPNRGQTAKVDRDLRRTIYDDDAQTVYG